MSHKQKFWGKVRQKLLKQIAYWKHDRNSRRTLRSNLQEQQMLQHNIATYTIHSTKLKFVNHEFMFFSAPSMTMAGHLQNFKFAKFYLKSVACNYKNTNRIKNVSFFCVASSYISLPYLNIYSYSFATYKHTYILVQLFFTFLLLTGISFSILSVLCCLLPSLSGENNNYSRSFKICMYVYVQVCMYFGIHFKSSTCLLH